MFSTVSHTTHFYHENISNRNSTDESNKKLAMAACSSGETTALIQAVARPSLTIAKHKDAPSSVIVNRKSGGQHTCARWLNKSTTLGAIRVRQSGVNFAVV